MRTRAPKILLVEPAPVADMLVVALERLLGARVTHVKHAAVGLEVQINHAHDLVIAAMDLADADGLHFTSALAALGSAPIILTAREPTRADAIEAMRLGVRDLLIHPVPVERLLEAAQAALHEQGMWRASMVRYQRMRKLVHRARVERRDLRRRIELICRDLVGAHRRLVDRVLARE